MSSEYGNGAKPTSAAADARKQVVQRVEAILLSGDEETSASPRSALAVVHLVDYIVSGRQMPSFIEDRWKEAGVLTENGVPNAAMLSWAKYLLGGAESDEVLTGILAILCWLYDADSIVNSEAGKDLGITV